MSDDVFPTFPGLTFSVIKSPNWSTRQQRAVSGRELRVADFDNPIWRFTLTYSVLHDEKFGATYTPPNTALRTMMDWINSRSGGFDTFLYDDPTDDTATGQQIGVGDSATSSFQMGRQLIAGGFYESLIAINTVTDVKLNGVVDSPANYTVNKDTGIITFTSAPTTGVIITSDFTYYFRVRLDTDTLDFEEFMYNLWELKQLKLVSVLL